MGLFTFTIAGGSLVLIGTLETLVLWSSSSIQNLFSSSKSRTNPLTAIATSLLSFFFIVNCIVSLIDAIDSHDGVGSSLQLQQLAIASLFFLYSVLAISTNFTESIQLPSSILNLVCLFAFLEEFLFFYAQRKDTAGIENRYFDLMLVPVSICVFSTLLELKLSDPNSIYPRLGRAVGLILQGTWFLQMGLSFYTDLIAHGCALHEKSRGNYTIRCKGHSEYHRARAIAALQFNCHLSFLVVVIAIFYSILSEGNVVRGDLTRYKQLGGEIQMMDNDSSFTLDSDDEEVIEDGKNSGENGYGSHH